MNSRAEEIPVYGLFGSYNPNPLAPQGRPHENNRDEVAEVLEKIRVEVNTAEGPEARQRAFDQLVERAAEIGAEAVIGFYEFDSGESWHLCGQAIRTVDGTKYLRGQRSDRATVAAQRRQEQEQKQRQLQARSRSRRRQERRDGIVNKVRGLLGRDPLTPLS